MFIVRNEFCYQIELSGDIDYFKVIMQMRVDLENEFEYDKETNSITVVTLTESDTRGLATRAFKKYGNKLFLKNSYINRLSRLLNDSYKNGSDVIHLNEFSEDGDDDYQTTVYSQQEIHLMIFNAKKEIEDLFGSDISFTNDENAFIQAVSTHHLLKDIPKQYKWIARTRYL